MRTSAHCSMCFQLTNCSCAVRSAELLSRLDNARWRAAPQRLTVLLAINVLHIDDNPQRCYDVFNFALRKTACAEDCLILPWHSYLHPENATLPLVPSTVPSDGPPDGVPPWKCLHCAQTRNREAFNFSWLITDLPEEVYQIVSCTKENLRHPGELLHSSFVFWDMVCTLRVQPCGAYRVEQRNSNIPNRCKPNDRQRWDDIIWKTTGDVHNLFRDPLRD